MGRRILLLGGSGLIGRALLDHWQGRGDDLVLASRRPTAVHGLPRDTRVVGWDPDAGGSLSALVDGADAIVNLAGENVAGGRWTVARKRELRNSRLATGAAVTQAVAAARRRPAVLLQASAVGVYGSRGDEVLDESAAPGADFLGRLCVEWEASTATVEALGVRRVLLRTGIVLARTGGALPRMALPFRLFVGGPVGSGRQWLPWIHLADEVAAIDFLLDGAKGGPSQRSGAFNLTAPNPLTNRDFARELGRALGRPSALAVPAGALRLVFGEMADVLLAGQRALPRRLLDLGFGFRFPTARSALGDVLGASAGVG